jgi:hypothetical protein
LIVTAITCHWIDKDFYLHEALLDFKKLYGRHTGEMLAREVFNTLQEYTLANKLMCITTDYASNNIKMMKELSHILHRTVNVNWSWEEHHINCLNHVINLGVEWFIKSIKAENTDSEMSSISTPFSEGDESEEEDILLLALQIDDTEDSEEASFSSTMKRVRSIVKVVFFFSIFVTHNWSV